MLRDPLNNREGMSDRIIINGKQVRIEGKSAALSAAMQNKTAVRNGVLTAVGDWLPE